MALFNKKEKEESLPTPGPMRVMEVQVPEPKKAHSAEEKELFLSLVGPSVRIKGELLGDENLTVEGHTEGIIDIKRNLIIGEKGLVEAEVHAETVTIHGRLVGNIIADSKVEILPSGSLEGNIRSPRVVIAEGAHFKGNVDMSAGGEAGAQAPDDRSAKPGQKAKAPPRKE